MIKLSGGPSAINYITYTNIGTNDYEIQFQHEYAPNNIQTLATVSSVTFTSNVNTVSGPYTLTGGNTYVFSDVCFLEGTAIATPAGEVAVESLKTGDLVTTIVAGEAVSQPVKWVGYRSVKPGDLTGDDAHPIRIKAGAFAENIPHRDLLVTPEHCILVNGGLTPARQLVNGRSIIADTGISSFTYYHVELEQHGILLAEGLTTESYLDTGNRSRFANNAVTSFRFSLTDEVPSTAWEHAAAPLTVDTASVEPAWRALDARAQALGLVKTTAEPALTTDPELRLVTAEGAVIQPLRHAGDKYLFMVPAGSEGLHLVSRTARPSDTVGPFVNDRRQLGVLVGEIMVHDGRKKIAVAGHLTAEGLAGWFNPEATSQRWTSGNAELPVPSERLRGKAVILEVQILSAGPYLVETATPGQAAQAA